MNEQLTETINAAIEFALSNLHTATIARVTAVNADTVDVRPVINRVVNGQSIGLPVFTKVPPVFMQGGGSYLAFPIAVGDYCLLILTERCFDAWYNGSDFVQPAEFRMHDYSDGLAIFGVNPRAGAITIPEVIKMVGNAEHDGNMVRTGTLTQTGNVTITGNISATGSISSGNGQSGTVTAGGFIMTFTNGDLTGLVPVP